MIKNKATEKVSDIIFDPKAIKICSIAKLMPTKGFDRLIKVHSRLISEGLYHHIYIVGSGEQQRELESLISQHKVMNTFHLIGFKENPYKYLSACDLYVCSSRREGFSTAVTEALILGKPVVSTCCSGAYELLGEHDEYGIVTENSEEGIYAGLKKMLGTPGLIDIYAKEAEKRGTAFESSVTVKAVEDLFERLLNE